MFIHVLYIYSNPRDSRYEIIFNFQSSIFNLLGVAGAPGEGIFSFQSVTIRKLVSHVHRI